MRKHDALTLSAAGLFIVGCASILYAGDGRLHDAGPLAASERYVLDLGPIDLSASRTYAFNLSQLPNTPMTVGLYIVAENVPVRALYESKPINTMVTVEMTNDRGEQVLSERGELSSWTWSGRGDERDRSFVYRSGAFHEVPVRPGVTTGVRDGELADAGWGTYFTPRSNGRYALHILVGKPVPADA